MAVIPPWAIDAQDNAPEYDGAALRALFSAPLATQPDNPTRAVPGVLSGLDVFILDDVVYVSEGLVVVDGELGSYVTGLSADVGIALEPRDATNPRIDRLVFTVADGVTGAAGDLVILPGTPAATPEAPPTPGNAESLGTIAVPVAGGSGAVFNPGQRYTASRGGIVHVPDAAARGRTAAAHVPSADRPLYVHRANADDGFELEVTTDGSTWRSIPAEGAGDIDWQTVPLTANGGGTIYAKRTGRMVTLGFEGVTATSGGVIANLQADFQPSASNPVNPRGVLATTGTDPAVARVTVSTTITLFGYVSGSPYYGSVVYDAG